ncbi:MAG: amidohydrolase family protein, partial [Actinomycetota bacterium]
MHADRAFARAPRTASSLKDGVELVQAVRARFTEEDVCSRATRLFTRALSRGVLNIRSHVDVDHVVEGRSLAGVLRARGRFRDDLRVAIIAFANARLDPSSSAGDRRLRDAVERGATFVGGAVNFHPDPGKSIDSLLDLAVELGVDVDVHIDETTDPDDFNLEYLAESTIEHGLSGRVTASHACALAYVPAAVAKRTIDRVREAGITIIANPATNLFVMGRGNGTPRQRGITLVKELIEAGVPVRFASDSASDVFYPYGSSDPLEIAF